MTGRSKKTVGLKITPSVILSGMAGCLVVTFLFYNRLWGLIPGIPAGIYIAAQVKRAEYQRGIRKRRETFRRLLLSMETGLEAGYSLENALFTAVEDMGKIYRSGSEMRIMLENLRKKVKIGCPVWQAIQQMGLEEGIEEAEEFAEVLAIQQRTGGNMIRTMRNTVDKIQSGIEVQQEIDAAIAEKRLEQRIMTLMPGMILIYMRLMNASYMKPLYTTAAGVLVMTAALGLNILGDFLGSRIVG
jgi:tight adherence protein B